jgi:hypothetical protein
MLSGEEDAALAGVP